MLTYVTFFEPFVTVNGQMGQGKTTNAGAAIEDTMTR